MRVLVTGSAGFIGFHLARLLLEQGVPVQGYDGMTDYYDLRLKKSRHSVLRKFPNFSVTEGMLEEQQRFDTVADGFIPDVIVHLAAQAGVRYSLENPRAYLETNIIGTFNVMEAARRHKVRHLLMASSSSVYGANDRMPFAETDKADTQLTIYAATKKANESMAHAYSYLWNLPTTMLRFFTVYGPWGRPDMALFKFTDAILAGRPIDVYNDGDMYRDFTYAEDLARCIKLLIDVAPKSAGAELRHCPGDSISPVAPFRIVNIGNADPVLLSEVIHVLEDCLGRKANRNAMSMQMGDVRGTFADVSLLKHLTGYCPNTKLRDGVASFVHWFKEYYSK